MTMTNLALVVNTEIHDFIAHVSSITFDFSEYQWEESFESEAEWTAYQKELSSKYSTFSVHFKDYDLPDSDDEDETQEEFYESTHCAEEGYYYRILERWIDEEICWLFHDLKYSIEKV